jgi:3-methyladenine DNA glycosylase AlkD
MSVSNALAWLAEVEAALRAQADAQQAVPMKAYMLGQFEFLGVRRPPARCAQRLDEICWHRR